MKQVAKKTKKYLVLNMPIYRTQIIVKDIKNHVSVLSDIGLKNEAIDTNTEGAIADCQIVTKRTTGAKAVLMRLPVKYDETTLWHESIHCAAMILDDICGIEYTNDYAEILAYNVEWIVKMIKKNFYGKTVDFHA